MSVTVKDVMTRDVVTVGPAWSLASVAQLFAARHITGAPVIDGDGKAVGVVSQSDLLDPERRRYGKSAFYQHTTHVLGPVEHHEGTVADSMSPFVVAVAPDAPLLDAVRLMAMDDLHRLLVIDHGKLVGIVTSMDVLRALAGHDGARIARDLRTGV